MNIYCTIRNCSNWTPIDEPVQKKTGIGYVPFGNVGKYDGKCKLSGISIKESTSVGGHTKQVLPLCSNYSPTGEEAEAVVEGSFSCTEERCAFYADVNQCTKVNQDQDLYVGLTVSFSKDENGLEHKKEVPNCKSFAHRRRENAIDWTRVYATS